MSPRSLVISSVVFVVLWTAGMLWWNSPDSTGGVLALIIAGTVAGALWYWIVGWWLRRHGQQASW